MSEEDEFATNEFEEDEMVLCNRIEEMINNVDSLEQCRSNNEVITSHSTQNNELNNMNANATENIANHQSTSHSDCDTSLSTNANAEANENVPGNRIKAVISSEGYINYLQTKEKKKTDIENQKKEKRKIRLEKAVENMDKMLQNINKLKNQVQEDGQN